MKEQVEAYLNDHRGAWAATTYKTECARLLPIANFISNPESLHAELLRKGSKPYTIKTTFVRIAHFERWLKQDLGYETFLKKHQSKFRYAYQKKEIKMDYAEAKTRIETLEQPYKAMATDLLLSGLRISELYKVEDQKVIGKGGKARQVFSKIQSTTLAPRSTFYLKLKKIGLTAHMLRALSATRLSEKGATPADLCKIFGWSSIKTAYQYLQSKDDSRLNDFVEKAHQE